MSAQRKRPISAVLAGAADDPVAEPVRSAYVLNVLPIEIVLLIASFLPLEHYVRLGSVNSRARRSLLDGIDDVPTEETAPRSPNVESHRWLASHYTSWVAATKELSPSNSVLPPAGPRSGGRRLRSKLNRVGRDRAEQVEEAVVQGCLPALAVLDARSLLLDFDYYQLRFASAALRWCPGYRWVVSRAQCATYSSVRLPDGMPDLAFPSLAPYHITLCHHAGWIDGLRIRPSQPIEGWEQVSARAACYLALDDSTPLTDIYFFAELLDAALKTCIAVDGHQHPLRCMGKYDCPERLLCRLGQRALWQCWSDESVVRMCWDALRHRLGARYESYLTASPAQCWRLVDRGGSVLDWCLIAGVQRGLTPSHVMAIVGAAAADPRTLQSPDALRTHIERLERVGRGLLQSVVEGQDLAAIEVGLTCLMRAPIDGGEAPSWISLLNEFHPPQRAVGDAGNDYEHDGVDVPSCLAPLIGPILDGARASNERWNWHEIITIVLSTPLHESIATDPREEALVAVLDRAVRWEALDQIEYQWVAKAIAARGMIGTLRGYVEWVARVRNDSVARLFCWPALREVVFDIQHDAEGAPNTAMMLLGLHYGAYDLAEALRDYLPPSSGFLSGLNSDAARPT